MYKLSNNFFSVGTPFSFTFFKRVGNDDEIGARIEHSPENNT
jgi:hypothetical protein